MADVKEDYTTDICLLQTAVNLGVDEAVVGVTVGFLCQEMRKYTDEKGYDPKKATDEELEKALKEVCIKVQERLNEEVTDGLELQHIYAIAGEFSNVVDEVKNKEREQ